MKTRKEFAIANRPFCFDVKLPSDIESELVLQLHEKLVNHSTITEKCVAIDQACKSVCDGSSNKEWNSLVEFLFFAFLQLDSNSLLKNIILESQERLRAHCPERYFSIIHKIIATRPESKEHYQYTINKMMLFIERRDLVVTPFALQATDGEENNCLPDTSVISCILRESIDLIRSVWFRTECPHMSMAETNRSFQLIHQIIKYLTIIHQKENKSLQSDCLHYCDYILRRLTKEIIFSETASLDLRTSCGLLFTQIEIAREKSFLAVFNRIFNEERPFGDGEEIGLMVLFHGLLSQADGELLFRQSSTCTLTPSVGSQSSQSSTCTLSSRSSQSSTCTLSSRSSEEIQQTVLSCLDVDDIATKMLKRVFHIVNTAQIGTVAILGSRILNHLMLKLLEHSQKKHISSSWQQRYSVYSENSRKIQDTIWLLWDHFLDCVKHLARETFILFIKVLENIDKAVAATYFKTLSSNLLKTLPNKKSYSALTCLTPFIEVDSILVSLDTIKSLIMQMSDPSFSAHAANMLEAMFIKHLTEVDYREWYKLWFSSFFKNFCKRSLVYGFENLLEKLLLCSEDMTQPIAMLSQSTDWSDDKTCLLLICAKIHLKHLKVEEGKKSAEDAELWRDVLPFYHLIHALGSGNDDLSILALNLIAENRKSTELFDECELNAVLQFLERNIVNEKPSCQQKIVNSVRKIFCRMHKGLHTKKKSMKSSEFLNIRNIHEEFILKLLKFMKNNLFVGASFPRRSISLQILTMIMNLMEEGAPFEYLRPEVLRQDLSHTLILSLSDSYEANKQIALHILMWLNDKTLDINDRQTSEYILDGIWSLTSSTKPPDSLTASYLLDFFVSSSLVTVKYENIPEAINEHPRIAACWTVLLKLKSELQVAQTSLLKASSSGPMYGLLLCLKRLFADVKIEEFVNKEHLWSDLIKETIRTCHSVVDVVSDVVKNSSPEGHLPMDYTSCSESLGSLGEVMSSSIAAQEFGFNEEMDYSESELVKAQAVSSQMLLLCGWRSVKEVALLFGLFVQGSSLGQDFLSLLSLDDVKAIGNFYIVQLTETKHRGAFEQAYSGFEMVCRKLWKCSDREMAKLPELWLSEVVRIVQDDNDTKLCATRRSAGVPYIIQAIISTEPSVYGAERLKTVMNMLLKLSNLEKDCDPKIHALNILRTLYRDTRLGESVIPFVSKGVKTAVRGYESKSWSVRNSSSLMFAAIVTRMLGVKKTQEDFHSKNAASALIFFKRYPDLYDFFIENLKIAVMRTKMGAMSNSAFPILLILARLSPPSSDGYSSSIPLTPFVPFVLDLCRSPVFKLRSLASKALIPLISPLTLVEVTGLLLSCLRLKDQNELHGSLLCLSQILTSFSGIIVSSEEIRSKLTKVYSQASWAAFESNPCYFTRSCAIDLYTYIVKERIFPSLNLKPLTASCFSMLLNSHNLRVYVPGSDIVVRSATNFFLTVNETYNKDNNQHIEHLLTFPSVEVQKTLLNHCSTLTSFSQSMIQKLITEVQHEKDSDCRRLQLNLLSKAFSSLKIDCYSLYSKELDILCHFVLHRLNMEQREDILAAVVQLSGIILLMKLKLDRTTESNFLLSWIDHMTTCSDANYVLETRLSVIEAVGKVLYESRGISGRKDELEVQLLEIITEALTDDDDVMRVQASTHISFFLSKLPYEMSKVLQLDNPKPSSVVMENIFYYLVSKGGDAHFTSLLLQALKEEVAQEFGLSQEEDRAFDKGETQILRENITLSKMVSETIERFQVKVGNSFILKKTILLDRLTDHLLLPLPSSLQKDRCTIYQFLTVLKRDLEYILDIFGQLRTVSPFGMKRFDLWVERLVRRAYVWKALKRCLTGGDRFIDNLLLDNLKCSLVQPSIFSTILECLS